MSKKESFYWDIVKGTAIFLMLWGHCIQYCSPSGSNYFKDIVFKTIYTFHMPVFMLVSGYLFYYSFQKRNLTDLLKHRIQAMLHPIIMATIFGNILILIPKSMLADRVDILFGSLFLGIDTYFWFLWAVLYCSVIVAVFCKWTDRPYLQCGLTILGCFVILLVPQWDMTLFMYPYFVAGFFCGMYRKHAKRLYHILKYVSLLVFPILLSFYETKHYIYITPMFSEELGLWGSVEIALFRWLIGFVGSVWMLTIMEFLMLLGERMTLVQSLLEAVSCLGRNSLQMYCLSLSLLSGYLPHIYDKFVELTGTHPFAKHVIAYDFLFTPVLAVIWSVLLYSVVLLMRKYKVHKLIFGR